ncbi:MAG: hypothetical protein HW421_3130 [Ignavibacteria bacterium]|nr:hypothetical protein [Ignavibacteria bacterium]
MIETINTSITCPCCMSNNIIHYGRTRKGTKRFHCAECNKTWSDYQKNPCPCLEELVEEYLSGESYRHLQDKYHASAHHLNERIRSFLTKLPSWENYVDTCVPKYRESRLIHLIDLSFHCYDDSTSENGNNGDHNHTMYLALAVDALSNLILGFEIDNKESKDIWYYLLDRLNCRGILCPVYMSKGSKYVEEVLSEILPHSTHLTQYFRKVFDRDLQNRIKMTYETDRLLTEAFASYQSVIKPQFREYSFLFKEKKMREILEKSKIYFKERLETRIITRSFRRIEGLKEHFIERFKGFRILKENPYPLVNGWIAQSMLSPLDFGFSRLSLYMQTPVQTSFKQFSNNQLPIPLDISEESDEMRKFVIEIAIRGLQISNFMLPRDNSFQ